MNDSRMLLDRISAFRQRLEQSQAGQSVPAGGPPVPAALPKADPTPVPDSEEGAGHGPPPSPPNGVVTPSASSGLIDRTLRTIAGPADVNEGPVPPQLTDRVRRVLVLAQGLLAWQRQFTSDAVFAGLTADEPGTHDPLVAYHRETVAMMDSAVRFVQAFPSSPSVQFKLCDGLEGILDIVKERQGVQDRALKQRKNDLHRVDRLAAVLAALHQRRAVTLKPLAALAEELLEEARQSQPLRFLEVDPASTVGYAGGLTFPAPRGSWPPTR